MYAIRQHEFGGPENLLYQEVPTPSPAPGQVRVKVAAAGVHVLDTVIRSGTSGGPFPLPDLPMIPGREVAGTVDAVGSDTDREWVGAGVVAHLGMASAGYAEYAVVAVEALHRLPEGTDPQKAVAMIGTGRTTMAVLEGARLTRDDVVLLTAAAGGIGNLVVQAARNAGAFVVGLASGGEKAGKVAALGADAGVDYSVPGWEDKVREALNGREITAVMDSVGGEAGQKALELLGVGGRILLFGWSAGEPTQITTADLYSRGLTATSVLGPGLFRRPGGLRSLETAALAALGDGSLVPLTHAFPLAGAAQAHAALEARKTTGKVVLIP